MKKKKYFMLAAALTVSCAFLLNGCDFSLPDLSGNEGVSAEAENLIEGNIQLYSRWYNESSEKLTGTTVSFYNGDELLFQGTTDANGSLGVCTLPANTELKCILTDASGTELASSDIIYKISENYSDFTIYTIGEESEPQQVNIPAGKTDISAALYITGSKAVSHSNVAQYNESAVAGTVEPAEGSTDGTSDESSQDGTDEASQDGQEQDGADGSSQDGQGQDNTDGSSQDGQGQDNTDDSSQDGQE